MMRSDRRVRCLQNMKKIPESLDLCIDEIVIKDLPKYESDDISRNLKESIKTVFSGNGIPEGMNHRKKIPLIDAGEIRNQTGSGSERIGEQIADAVYKGMKH